MTQRERLVTAILALGKMLSEIPGILKLPTDKQFEIVAECLMKIGVILPPCKIGDEVYRISKRYGCWEVLPRYVDSLTFGRDYTGELVWILETTTDDILGNTVFLTREEAEEEIRRRKEVKPK